MPKKKLNKNQGCEVKVLHLSDIHLGLEWIVNNKESYKSSGLSPEDYIAQSIVNDIRGTVVYSPDIIVISGDMTQEGTPEEFEGVFKFLTSLLARLNKKFSLAITTQNLVIVPGNHDICWPDNKHYFLRNREKEPHLMCEKFENYSSFIRKIYDGQPNISSYDFDKGYMIYRYPSKGLVVIGFDSCLNNSFRDKERPSPGVISEDNIESAFSELEDRSSYPYRIAVFHHNPTSNLTDQGMQEDYLTSADSNIASFWENGVSVILHGHSHDNILRHLDVKVGGKRKSHKIIAIGSGTLGGAEYTKSLDANRYQFISVKFGEKVEVQVNPRVFAQAQRKGKGQWIKDPKFGRSENKQVIDAPRMQKQLQASIPLDANSTLDESSLLALLDEIRLAIIIRDFDRAKNNIDTLKEQNIKPSMQGILNYFSKRLDLYTLKAKNALSKKDERKEWSSLMEFFEKNCIDSPAKLIPQWFIESERVYIQYNALESKGTNNDISIINSLLDVFEKSQGQDLVALHRRIKKLLALEEIGHARQSLQKAFALDPEFPPFQMNLAELLIKELRYHEALEYLQRYSGKNPPIPRIEHLISYCHYFVGNLDECIKLSQEGFEKWPDLTAFRNNYAFARLRKILRDYGEKLWKNNTEQAQGILSDFLMAITKEGTFGVAHFNAALMLYWAREEGKVSEAKQTVIASKVKGRIASLSDKQFVSSFFERARRAFEDSEDFFRMAMASYFAQRVKVKGGGKKDEETIMDELFWDVDNFFSYRNSLNKWRKGLLHKNENIRPVDDYLKKGFLTTLKRWMHIVQPMGRTDIRTGGGYFLKWNGYGIVLDPGDGFINNFQRRGHCISEIDAIIVSSTSYQYYEEFYKLMDLVQESCTSRNKKIRIFLEENTWSRFSDINISHKNVIDGNIELLSFGKSGFIRTDSQIEINIDMHPSSSGIQNLCNEYSKDVRPAPILLLTLRKDDIKRKITLVHDIILNDTVLETISDFDILILSVGTIYPSDLLNENEISETLRGDLDRLFGKEPIIEKSYGKGLPENRPYVGIKDLLGIADSIKNRDGIVILSDLPIELGDKRLCIAKILNNRYEGGPVFLTEDTGLIISLPELQILCEYEYEMVLAREIEEECLKGNPIGAVKHFCSKHRGEVGFVDFLSRPF